MKLNIQVLESQEEIVSFEPHFAEREVNLDYKVNSFLGDIDL